MWSDKASHVFVGQVRPAGNQESIDLWIRNPEGLDNWQDLITATSVKPKRRKVCKVHKVRTRTLHTKYLRLQSIAMKRHDT